MVRDPGKRRRTVSEEDARESSALSSSRLPPARRTGIEPIVDQLQPEEEYLLRVYKRYRATKTSSPDQREKGVNKSQTSSGYEHGLQKGGSVSSSSKDGRRITSAKSDDVPLSGTPLPSDQTSRLLMILKKRKELTGSRTLPSTSGAVGQRKAKMNKVVGATSASTSAKLDPVKYPSTGLLLLGEYRSFVESDEDGQRAFVSTEPLVRDLKNFGVADSSGTKKLLNETLVMRITVPPHSQSWGINLCPKDHDDFQEVFFHFNPRRRFVAMNHRTDNIWGQQEKYIIQRWPELFGVSITLAVQIDSVGFRIAIDGKYCATFEHKRDLPTNGEQVTLQVMTADDYGTNLGIIVHEIWWGHKDRMPGLPEERSDRQPSVPRPVDTRRGGEGDDAFVDLHIGNLPPMPSPEEQEIMRKRLLDVFHPYGVVQVRVFHREKYYGFAKFRDHKGAVKAMDELSGEQIQGRSIRLSKAASR